MKKDKKMILDICMIIGLVFCMEYNLTGNLLHEVIGIALIIGFIVHIAINFKYYNVMFKNNKALEGNVKHKLSFFINIVLLLVMLLMTLSSIFISKDILFFTNFDSSKYDFWSTLHVISAITMMICILVHIILHASLFKTFIKRIVEKIEFEKAWNIGSRCIAIIMSIFVVITSVRVSKDVVTIGKNDRTRYHEESYNTNEKYEEYKDDKEDEEWTDKFYKDEEDEDLTDDLYGDEEDEDLKDDLYGDNDNDNDKMSVDDYLSKLTCTGCGKRCPLLSPRCGRVVRQAEEAREEYYSEYETN